MGKGWGEEGPFELEDARGGRGVRKGKRRLTEGWGFDPLKGISKYITFKGSKERDLL